MLVHEQLRRFEGSIVAATKGGMAESIGDQWPRWTFSESLLYSLTVITTIGHGNLTPRTSEGKMFTMLYALVGVPLMLMCLSSLGGFLAEALQCSYGRLCGGSSSGGGSAGKREDGGKTHAVNNSQSVENETEFNFYNKYDPVSTREMKNIAKCNRDDSFRLIDDSPNISKTSSSLSPNAKHTTMTCCKMQNNNKTGNGHCPAMNANHIQQQQIPPSLHSQPTSPPPMRNLTSSNTRTINVYFPVNNRIQQIVNLSGQPQQQQQQQLQPQHIHHLHQSQMVALHQTLPPPPAGFTGNVVHSQQPQQQMAPPPTPSNYHLKPIVQISVNNGLLPPTNEFQRLIHHQQPAPPPTHQVQQESPTPPPPPHHTATVHGLGRSKFHPKPLPSEINVLMMTECDSSGANNCGNPHHHRHHNQHDSASSFPSNNESTAVSAASGKFGDVATTSMETLDDDDDDDNRNGYPHGTPSRKPLISSKLKQKLPPDSRATDTNRKCPSGKYLAVSQDDGDAEDNSLASHQSQQVPITLILIILIGYIAIGTAIFSLWENWSIVDGAYFCFVTLSTIGFGDMVPQKTFHGPDIQLFACCAYLGLGLVLVAMSFSLLETQLLWKCRRMAVRLKLASD